MVKGGKPNKRKLLKKGGFRKRMNSPEGKNVINSRRSKGRKALAAVKTFNGSW